MFVFHVLCLECFEILVDFLLVFFFGLLLVQFFNSFYSISKSVSLIDVIQKTKELCRYRHMVGTFFLAIGILLSEFQCV